MLTWNEPAVKAEGRRRAHKTALGLLGILKKGDKMAFLLRDCKVLCSHLSHRVDSNFLKKILEPMTIMAWRLTPKVEEKASLFLGWNIDWILPPESFSLFSLFYH